MLLLAWQHAGCALRKFLSDNGFKTIQQGGNVTVVPVAPADILTLMLKRY